MERFLSKVVKRYCQKHFCDIFTYERLQRAKNSSTDPRQYLLLSLAVISVKWQQICGIEQHPLPSLCSVGGLIDGLSTVFVDSLYSTLKVVMKLIDTKHKKVVFKSNEMGDIHNCETI